MLALFSSLLRFLFVIVLVNAYGLFGYMQYMLFFIEWPLLRLCS